jgi:regulator of sigma E protease
MDAASVTARPTELLGFPTVEALRVVVSIAVLQLLLIVHECGRYLVARWCRVRIERFAIGLGPPIFERTSQATGTTLRIGLVPFGAFVRIRGLDDANADPGDRHAFPSRSIWQQLATILAGPATSYLVVVALAMALYTCHGVDVPHWYGVGSVVPGSAATGKLQAGDVILAFDHTPMYVYNGPTLSERVNQGAGAPITLTIERNDERRDVVVEPKQARYARHAPIWLLGVQLETRDLAVGIGIEDAARRAFQYPVEQTRLIASALYRSMLGNETADPGGPVRMVLEFERAFQFGPVLVVQVAMLLGVYVGLFLALPMPIPLFDGGRLVSFVYRALTRRRSRPTP